MRSTQSRRIGVIGHGRFGRFWASMLRAHHDVFVTDTSPQQDPSFVPLEELCEQAEVVFLCVPINRMASALEAVRDLLRPGTVVFDTCSVKAHPAALMQHFLGSRADLTLIASHPMFGPDSGSSGVRGLPLALSLIKGSGTIYSDWKQFFEDLGLKIVEISPEAHDRYAAYSQGVTHYIGRVLGELDLHPTPIDTQGFSILLDLIEQTCNDSWELFSDLQTFNPHTREMRLELEAALDRIYSALLPERVSPEVRLIGVQGGEGSFSEEAARTFLSRSRLHNSPFEIRHHYTSDNVLTALHRGDIDYGVFAIQNAAGGVVLESIQALSRTNCEIIQMFDLVINHSILHHPDVRFDEVDTLISHPQALAQCAKTLQSSYAHLELTSGQGDLIDQALCAREIASGRLPKTTAVLAPRVCADLFNLVLHADNLQDLGAKNLTTFAWAVRRSRG